MARRNTAAQDAPAFDFNNVTVTDADYMPRKAPRVEKPNPLVPAVQDSLNSEKPKMLPNVPADAKKDADNFLRRAAVKLGCGIEIRAEENGDGTVNIHFRAKHEKRSRNYTVEDVRAWAEEQGYTQEELYPRVQKHVSDAYREMRGLKVNKNA